MYHAERNVLISKVNSILQNKDTITDDVLLHGREYLPLKRNVEMIELVGKYIQDTGRFQK